MHIINYLDTAGTESKNTNYIKRRLI